MELLDEFHKATLYDKWVRLGGRICGLGLGRQSSARIGAWISVTHSHVFFVFSDQRV